MKEVKIMSDGVFGGLFRDNGFFLVLILVIIVAGLVPCGCNSRY
jgi:hypothetical protein